MHQQDDTATDKQPNNTMNEIKTSPSATPSTSGKRRQSEEAYDNTTNEDSLPKKKRESAIRSGNNLKMLIQNKLLHYIPKQKVSSKNVLSLRKEARTETLKTLISTGKFNKLEKLYTKTVVAESHGSTVNDDTIATDDSDSNNEPDTIEPERIILEHVPINEPNPTNTTKTPGRSKSPLRNTVIATEDSDSNDEPDTIPPPDRNILELAPTSKPNTTNTTKKPIRSKTPLRDTVIATDDSDSINEPDTIPPPDRNILEPVPISEPNPTNTTKKPRRSKTLHDTVIATEDSDSSHEPESIHPSERNRPELIQENEPNPTNTTKISGKSKTPLPETVDSDPTQISYTNNLDQQKESNTNFKGLQSSLNGEVSALQNLIQHLAPENGTEHQNIVDIKHIEDIYNSILEVKSKMNAVYTEKSKQLKKAFESINLFVPELKKGLSLPTIQQLKENSRPNSDKLKTVSSLEDQPSQRKGPSSHPHSPPLQQSALLNCQEVGQSENVKLVAHSKAMEKNGQETPWSLF